MESIARAESGNYRYDVITCQKTGYSGELGIVQILPTWTAAAARYGTIGEVYERDWSAGGPYCSVWLQLDFLGWALAHGYRHHWHV